MAAILAMWRGIYPMDWGTTEDFVHVVPDERTALFEYARWLTAGWHSFGYANVLRLLFDREEQPFEIEIPENNIILTMLFEPGTAEAGMERVAELVERRSVDYGQPCLCQYHYMNPKVTVNGPCGQCNGSGKLPWFSHIDNGRCWQCNATGWIGEKKVTTHARWCSGKRTLQDKQEAVQMNKVCNIAGCKYCMLWAMSDCECQARGFDPARDCIHLDEINGKHHSEWIGEAHLICRGCGHDGT